MAYLEGWAQRIEITISEPDSDLTNFPHLLYLTSSSGTGSRDVTAVFDELSNANRKKIAVTASDGTTQLYVEIENWDATGEKASLWVKVPSILASGGATIYLYFDSTQSDNSSYVGDTTDAVTHNVWDSNFNCVFHMNQSPAATALKDSTSNGYQSSTMQSMDSSNLKDGNTGKSLYFDGSAEWIQTNAVGVGGTNERTLEAYCDFVNDTSDNCMMFYGYNANYRQWYFKKGDTSGQLEVQVKSGECRGTANMNNTGWHHVACVYPNGASGNLNETLFFIDGVSDSVSYSQSVTINTGTASTLFIVFYPLLNGDIQEIRMSNIERSAAWLKATAESLGDSFCSYSEVDLGVEEITIVCDPITLSLLPVVGGVAFDIIIYPDPISISLTPLGTYVGGFLKSGTIPITMTPVGEFVEGVYHSAGPINMTVSQIGTYVEGLLLSTSALITLGMSVTAHLNRALYTGIEIWKNYKDHGAWDLTEQGDKFGYLNSLNWSSDEDSQTFLSTIGIPLNPASKHSPCGHWHKIPPITYDVVERTKTVQVIDRYEYSGEANSVLFDKQVVAVNEGVVAIFYRGGTSEDFLLYTIGLDGSGNFTGTLDTLTIQEDTQDNQGETRILHVAGDVYACCYRADEHVMTVKTVSIASDGTISAVIDTEVFGNGTYADWAKIHDNVFLCCRMTWPSLYGDVSSFGITDEGVISTFIDTVRFEATYNLAYLNRISITRWGDSTFVIANRQAVPPASDAIGFYLLTCSTGGLLNLEDEILISKAGSDLAEYEPVSVGSTGKVGLKYADGSYDTYFRVYDISSGNFGTYTNSEPLRFTTAGANIDYGMLHWNEDNWIISFTSTGAGPFNVGIIRLENNVLDTKVYFELFVVSTGLNFNYSDFCKINNSLCVVAYTGGDSHGWLASIEMSIFNARIKSVLGSPINNEPQVWPM